MSKVISGRDLRERLLRQRTRSDVRPADAWIQVLATPGNRELLGLIALRRPQSISELSELAGRAQPNVSRSLTALINAGLVQVRSDGRASIPRLTALGLEKASDLKLTEQTSTESTAVDGRSGNGDLPFLSVSFEDSASTDDDEVVGSLTASLLVRGYDEPLVATMAGDLNSLAVGILDHWWRILCRRDAPYKIGEFNLMGGASERRASLAVRSTGDHIERIVRSSGEPTLQLERATRVVSVNAFEGNLIDDVLRPIVAQLRSRRRYDRPVQSKLTRIEDTLEHKRELQFARTAGALGVSPYDLTDEWAQKIRNLTTLIPDEGPRLDFSSAVLIDDVDAASNWAHFELSKQGEQNAMPELCALSKTLRPVSAKPAVRPWRRGTAIARALREHLDLAPDQAIRGVGEVAAVFGASGFQTSPKAPGSLRAFQCQSKGFPTVIVEDEGPERTKFVLARAIGDFLVFQSSASCVANLYTDRQAVGRAFAAEFVAPAEGVVRMIEDEDRSVVYVAHHYEVPEEVVSRQYENNYRRFTEA